MIKLSLKLDVSISKVALVFVGSVAFYSICQFVSSMITSASQENNENVSDKFSMDLKPDVNDSNENAKKFPTEKIEVPNISALEIAKMKNKVVGKTLEKTSAINIDKVKEELFVGQQSKSYCGNPKQSNENDHACNQKRIIQKNINPDNFLTCSQNLEYVASEPTCKIADENVLKTDPNFSTESPEALKEDKLKEDNRLDDQSI